MPDFRQLHDEDIHALYAELASQYQIPELNRDDPSIKYGLRNADGTGVIAGVSNIGSVQGYYMEDGVRQPKRIRRPAPSAMRRSRISCSSATCRRRISCRSSISCSSRRAFCPSAFRRTTSCTTRATTS